MNKKHNNQVLKTKTKISPDHNHKVNKIMNNHQHQKPKKRRKKRKDDLPLFINIYSI